MANRIASNLARAVAYGSAWGMAVLLASVFATNARAGEASTRASHADPDRTARTALAHHGLATLDGKPFTLSELRGQVVLVNFWASWCRPCRKELPRLDAFHQRIAGQGGAVAAVSIDLDPRNAERFAVRHQLSLPIYHDGPEGLASRLDLEGIPFSIVLDRNGAIVFTTTGADPDALDQLEAAVLARIAGKPVATRNRIEAAPASRHR